MVGKKGKKKKNKNEPKTPKMEPPLAIELKKTSSRREQQFQTLFSRYNKPVPSGEEIYINDLSNGCEEENEPEEESGVEEEEEELDNNQDQEVDVQDEFIENEAEYYNTSHIDLQEIEPPNPEIVQLIEQKYNNNLKQLYLAREISVVLDDDFEGIDRLVKTRISEALTHIDRKDLEAYLLSQIKCDFDKQIWNLIENIFGSQLKQFIINREKAESNEDYDYWKKKVLQEWSSLCGCMEEQDVLRYTLSILRPIRNPWLYV